MKVRQLPPRDVARRVGAAYDGEKDEIYIGPGSRKTLMSNILHEIQHAVQKREEVHTRHLSCFVSTGQSL